jgi:hypothetical protein
MSDKRIRRQAHQMMKAMDDIITAKNTGLISG